MRILLRKSSQGHNNLFEWSVNGRVWYPINYKRIIPRHNGDPNPFEVLAPFREAFNQMRFYAGFHISVFEGNYDREKKILSVTL